MSRLSSGGKTSSMSYVLMIPLILAAAVALFVRQAAQVTTTWTRTMQMPNGPSRSTMTKHKISKLAANDKTAATAATTTTTTATTATTASSTSIASIGYLPLLPWEAESMKANRTCSVPYTSATPASMDYPTSLSSCCIGSYSAAGRIQYEPNVCNWTVDVYRRHEQLALDAWSRIPLVSTTTKNTNCDVCQIMNVLLDNNWTMAFMGDSITGQSFVALECELRRRGYIVERQATDWRRPFMKGPWPVLQFGLHEVHELHIQRPAETFAGSTKLAQNTAILRYYRVYRPSANLTEVAELKARNDVLIFDHGLHYGPFALREFDVDMTKLMGALLKQSDNDNTTSTSSKKDWKLLAWRETSAQHFVGHVGGHYMGEKSKNASTCVATTYRNASTSGASAGASNDKLYFPRTAIMQRIMDHAKTAQHGSNNTSVNMLRILPFWHYTQPMYEMHPGGQDCAHYCYAPSFWLYLWRHLRNALDETVEEHAEPRL